MCVCCVCLNRLTAPFEDDELEAMLSEVEPTGSGKLDRQQFKEAMLKQLKTCVEKSKELKHICQAELQYHNEQFNFNE